MTWTWRRWWDWCPLRRNSADHREDDPPFLQTHGDPTNISIKIKQRWNLAIDCQGRHGVDNVDILFTYIISYPFLWFLRQSHEAMRAKRVDATNWQHLVPSDRHLYCHVFKYIITAQIACINHYFFVDVGTNLTTRICAAFEFKWDKLETVTCNDLLLVFLRPTDTDAVSDE